MRSDDEGTVSAADSESEFSDSGDLEASLDAGPADQQQRGVPTGLSSEPEVGLSSDVQPPSSGSNRAAGTSPGVGTSSSPLASRHLRRSAWLGLELAAGAAAPVVAMAIVCVFCASLDLVISPGRGLPVMFVMLIAWPITAPYEVDRTMIAFLSYAWIYYICLAVVFIAVSVAGPSYPFGTADIDVLDEEHRYDFFSPLGLNGIGSLLELSVFLMTLPFAFGAMLVMEQEYLRYQGFSAAELLDRSLLQARQQQDVVVSAVRDQVPLFAQECMAAGVMAFEAKPVVMAVRASSVSVSMPASQASSSDKGSAGADLESSRRKRSVAVSRSGDKQAATTSTPARALRETGAILSQCLDTEDTTTGRRAQATGPRTSTTGIILALCRYYSTSIKSSTEASIGAAAMGVLSTAQRKSLFLLNQIKWRAISKELTIDKLQLEHAGGKGATAQWIGAAGMRTPQRSVKPIDRGAQRVATAFACLAALRRFIAGATTAETQGMRLDCGISYPNSSQVSMVVGLLGLKQQPHEWSAFGGGLEQARQLAADVATSQPQQHSVSQSGGTSRRVNGKIVHAVHMSPDTVRRLLDVLQMIQSADKNGSPFVSSMGLSCASVPAFPDRNTLVRPPNRPGRKSSVCCILQNSLVDWFIAANLEVAAGNMSWGADGSTASLLLAHLPRILVSCVMVAVGLWYHMQGAFMPDRVAFTAYSAAVLAHVATHALFALETFSESCHARMPGLTTAGSILATIQLQIGLIRAYGVNVGTVAVGVGAAVLMPIAPYVALQRILPGVRSVEDAAVACASVWSQEQIDGTSDSQSWTVALTMSGSAIYMLAMVSGRLVQVGTLQSSLATVQALLQTTSAVLKLAKSQLATAAAALMPKSLILQHLRELKRQQQVSVWPNSLLRRTNSSFSGTSMGTSNSMQSWRHMGAWSSNATSMTNYSGSLSYGVASRLALRNRPVDLGRAVVVTLMLGGYRAINDLSGPVAALGLHRRIGSVVDAVCAKYKAIRVRSLPGMFRVAWFHTDPLRDLRASERQQRPQEEPPLLNQSTDVSKGLLAPSNSAQAEPKSLEGRKLTALERSMVAACSLLYQTHQGLQALSIHLQPTVGVAIGPTVATWIGAGPATILYEDVGKRSTSRPFFASEKIAASLVGTQSTASALRATDFRADCTPMIGVADKLAGLLSVSASVLSCFLGRQWMNHTPDGGDQLPGKATTSTSGSMQPSMETHLADIDDNSRGKQALAADDKSSQFHSQSGISSTISLAQARAHWKHRTRLAAWKPLLVEHAPLAKKERWSLLASSRCVVCLALIGAGGKMERFEPGKSAESQPDATSLADWRMAWISRLERCFVAISDSYQEGTTADLQQWLREWSLVGVHDLAAVRSDPGAARLLPRRHLNVATGETVFASVSAVADGQVSGQLLTIFVDGAGCDTEALATNVQPRASGSHDLNVLDLPRSHMLDYVRLKVIGEGGFARVYLAVHLPTGRKVALKVSRRSRAEREKHGQNSSISYSAGNSGRRASLKADVVRGEVLALMRCAVHGVEGTCRLEGVVIGRDEVGLVMQLLEGKSLASLLRTRPGRQRLTESAARVVGRQVACTLAQLHAAGVLHRDVKPSNLVLDGAGRVCLVDFGLAVDISKDGLGLQTVSRSADGSTSASQSGAARPNHTSDAWRAIAIDRHDDMHLVMPSYAPLQHPHSTSMLQPGNTESPTEAGELAVPCSVLVVAMHAPSNRHSQKFAAQSSTNGKVLPEVSTDSVESLKRMIESRGPAVSQHVVVTVARSLQEARSMILDEPNLYCSIVGIRERSPVLIERQSSPRLTGAATFATTSLHGGAVGYRDGSGDPAALDHEAFMALRKAVQQSRNGKKPVAQKLQHPRSTAHASSVLSSSARSVQEPTKPAASGADACSDSDQSAVGPEPWVCLVSSRRASTTSRRPLDKGPHSGAGGSDVQESKIYSVVHLDRGQDDSSEAAQMSEQGPAPETMPATSLQPHLSAHGGMDKPVKRVDLSFPATISTIIRQAAASQISRVQHGMQQIKGDQAEQHHWMLANWSAGGNLRPARSQSPGINDRSVSGKVQGSAVATSRHVSRSNLRGTTSRSSKNTARASQISLSNGNSLDVDDFSPPRKKVSFASKGAVAIESRLQVDSRRSTLNPVANSSLQGQYDTRLEISMDGEGAIPAFYDASLNSSLGAPLPQPREPGASHATDTAWAAHTHSGATASSSKTAALSRGSGREPSKSVSDWAKAVVRAKAGGSEPAAIGSTGVHASTDGSAASHKGCLHREQHAFVAGIAGTPLFMAPELFKHQGQTASDYWSFGVTLFWLLSGRMPFAGSTREEQYRAARRGQISWRLLPAGLSPECIDLLRGLLEVQAESRYNACVLAVHPWLMPDSSAKSESLARQLAAVSARSKFSSGGLRAMVRVRWNEDNPFIDPQGVGATSGSRTSESSGSASARAPENGATATAAQSGDGAATGMPKDDAGQASSAVSPLASPSAVIECRAGGLVEAAHPRDPRKELPWLAAVVGQAQPRAGARRPRTSKRIRQEQSKKLNELNAMAALAVFIRRRLVQFPLHMLIGRYSAIVQPGTRLEMAREDLMAARIKRDKASILLLRCTDEAGEFDEEITAPEELQSSVVTQSGPGAGNDGTRAAMAVAPRAPALAIPAYRGRNAVVSAFGLGMASLPSVIESEETSSHQSSSSKNKQSKSMDASPSLGSGGSDET